MAKTATIRNPLRHTEDEILAVKFSTKKVFGVFFDDEHLSRILNGFIQNKFF